MRAAPLTLLFGLFLLALSAVWYSQLHSAEHVLVAPSHTEPILRPTTSRSSDAARHEDQIDGKRNAEHSRVTWVGEKCLKGTELVNKKLLRECRESAAEAVPRAHRAFCARALNMSARTSSVGSEVACGYYATGRFTSPFAMSVAAPRRAHTCSKDVTAVTSAIFRSEFTSQLLPSSLSFSVLDPHTQLRQLVFRDCSPSFFAYFSREELVMLLHRASIGANGQGILFSGDSIMRQLMLRIVAYIRGETQFSEHYFHQDGLYVLRRNGDELVVLDTNGLRSHGKTVEKYFPGYHAGGGGTDSNRVENGDDDDVLLAIMFLWEQQPATFRREVLRMPKIPLHIAAFMYWWDNKGLLTDIDEYMRLLGAKHQAEEPTACRRDEPSNCPLQYLYVTTPWTSPKLFGGVDAEKRLARNSKAVRWVEGTLQPSPAAEHGRRSYGIVDFSGIAEVEHLNKTLDGIHYACIWLPKYPDLVRRQKYNHDECRDHMSLAVVQWLAHAVLHASSVA